MKKFEIWQELPKYDRDTKWANAVVKMVHINLLNAELPQPSICKKKKKKMQCLWSAIKQGAIKWGMPVIECVTHLLVLGFGTGVHKGIRPLSSQF